MNKTRLEAFSDGVIAIIITIMVLELRAPHGHGLADLNAVWPVLLRYLLSFIYVGIYWVNHHALFQRAERIDGAVLWANLHLLFWLSLIPFVTAWAGEYPMESAPVALYGAVLMMSSISFMLLARELALTQPACHDAAIHRKNRLSLALYGAAIALSLWYAPAGSLLHVLIALLWLKPGGALRA